MRVEGRNVDFRHFTYKMEESWKTIPKIKFTHYWSNPLVTARISNIVNDLIKMQSYCTLFKVLKTKQAYSVKIKRQEKYFLALIHTTAF